MTYIRYRSLKALIACPCSIVVVRTPTQGSEPCLSHILGYAGYNSDGRIWLLVAELVPVCGHRLSGDDSKLKRSTRVLDVPWLYRQQPCGHLLGKGWRLGSRLWCPAVSLSLSHWYPAWLYRFLIFAPLLLWGRFWHLHGYRVNSHQSIVQSIIALQILRRR